VVYNVPHPEAKAVKEKVKALREACQTDLKFLCMQILGMKDWQDGLHDELSDFLKTRDKQKLILMPRGHLKSSIVTVGYSIQRILQSPNIRILITNAVWDQTREFLRQISDYLTTQSQLPQIFGQFRHKDITWTRNEITIAQKNDPTKRGPTIRTAGVESVLTGSHCDLIIHDDLVELNNIQTKEQIKKVIQFHDASLDVLDPGGQMIDIGTRWAEDDLYGVLLKEHTKAINGQEIAKDKTWRDYVKL